MMSSLGLTDAASATGLKIGDVITILGCVAVDNLIKNWSPYYAASNQAAVCAMLPTS